MLFANYVIHKGSLVKMDLGANEMTEFVIATRTESQPTKVESATLVSELRLFFLKCATNVSWKLYISSYLGQPSLPNAFHKDGPPVY
jgi:hypothetical protein